MSDEMTKQPDETDDMLPEYDFSGSVRGKHYRAYQRGYTIIVHKIDGTTEERDYIPPEGAVMLDPDVRACFPDAEAVNTALRSCRVSQPVHFSSIRRRPTSIPSRLPLPGRLLC